MASPGPSLLTSGAQHPWDAQPRQHDQPKFAPAPVATGVGAAALRGELDGERSAELAFSHWLGCQLHPVLAEEDVGDGDAGENEAPGENQVPFVS